MTLCASSIMSFFSAVTRRTWLCSASDRAEKSCEGKCQDEVQGGQRREREHTSDSLVSRSWLGTPISSKSPCSWPMMVLTCWAR